MSNRFAALADASQFEIVTQETDERATEQQAFTSIAGDDVLKLSPTFSPEFSSRRTQLFSIGGGRYAYATSTNDICFGDISTLRQALVSLKTTKSDDIFEPMIRLAVGAPVSHVAFSADGTKLYVAALQGGLLIYDTATIQAGGREQIQIPSLTELSPNPISDSVAFLTTDGELLIRHGGRMASIAKDITAISWSKKGKQLIAGTHTGALVQYTPDGIVKAELSCVNDDAGKVNAVSWLENNLFAIAYQDMEDQINVYLLRRSVAAGNTTLQYTLISNPSLSFGDTSHPPNFFFLSISSTLLLTASTTSADIGLISIAHNASLSIDDDVKKATLRFSADRDVEVSIVGLALESDETQQLKTLWYTDNDGAGAAWIVQDEEHSLFDNVVVAAPVVATPAAQTSSPFAMATSDVPSKPFSFASMGTASAPLAGSTFSAAQSKSSITPMFSSSALSSIGSQAMTPQSTSGSAAFGSNAFGSTATFGSSNTVGSTSFGVVAEPGAKEFAGFGQASAFQNTAPQQFKGFGQFATSQPATPKPPSLLRHSDRDDSDDGMDEDKLANLDDQEPALSGGTDPFGNIDSLQVDTLPTKLEAPTDFASKLSFPMAATEPSKIDQKDIQPVSTFGTFNFPQPEAGGFGSSPSSAREDVSRHGSSDPSFRATKDATQADKTAEVLSKVEVVPSLSVTQTEPTKLQEKTTSIAQMTDSTPDSTADSKPFDKARDSTGSLTAALKISEQSEVLSTAKPAKTQMSSSIPRSSKSFSSKSARANVPEPQAARTTIKQESEMQSPKKPFGFGSSITRSPEASLSQSGFGFGSCSSLAKSPETSMSRTNFGSGSTSFGFGGSLTSAVGPKEALISPKLNAKEGAKDDTDVVDDAPLPPDPTEPPPEIDFAAFTKSRKSSETAETTKSQPDNSIPSSSSDAGVEASVTATEQKQPLPSDTVLSNDIPLPAQTARLNSETDLGADTQGPTDTSKNVTTSEIPADAPLPPDPAPAIDSSPATSQIDVGPALEAETKSNPFKFNFNPVLPGEFERSSLDEPFVSIPKQQQSEVSAAPSPLSLDKNGEAERPTSPSQGDFTQFSDDEDDYETEEEARTEETSSRHGSDASTAEFEDDSEEAYDEDEEYERSGDETTGEQSDQDTGDEHSQDSGAGSSAFLPKTPAFSSMSALGDSKQSPFASRGANSPFGTFGASPAEKVAPAATFDFTAGVKNQPKSEPFELTDKPTRPIVNTETAPVAFMFGSNEKKEEMVSAGSLSGTGNGSISNKDRNIEPQHQETEPLDGRPHSLSSGPEDTHTVKGMPENDSDSESQYRTVKTDGPTMPKSFALGTETKQIEPATPPRSRTPDPPRVPDMPMYLLLDQASTAKSSESGVARQIDIIHQELNEELHIIGLNLKSLSDFMGQTKALPQCLDNVLELKHHAMDLTKVVDEYNTQAGINIAALTSLKSSMITLETHKVKIQRLLRAQTDSTFAQSIRLSSLGPENAAHQKDIRRLMATVEKDLSEFQSQMTMIKTRLAAGQGASAPTISPENISTAISKIMRVAKQKEHEIEELQRRFVGTQLSSPDDSFRSSVTGGGHRHRKSYSKLGHETSIDLSMSQMSMLDQSYASTGPFRQSPSGAAGGSQYHAGSMSAGPRRDVRQAGEKRRALMAAYRAALRKGTPTETVASS